MDRRSFLKGGLALGGGLFGVQGLLARPTVAKTAWNRSFANEKGGYGPLFAKPSKNTGETFLALPDGFEYTTFGAEGSRMTDKRLTAGAHDGMAAFQVNGKVKLVRNHEVRNKPENVKLVGPKGKSYDSLAGGGTSTLTVDPLTRELISDYASLSGTLVNCAGGMTPWGTWLTCEETCAGPILSQVYHKDKEQGGGFLRNHGYVFEVDATKDGLSNPTPIKEMGRFVHEAVAVDPATGIVYQTEDSSKAGFYRYIPNVPGKLAKGGILQIAKVKGVGNVDTRTKQTDKITYEIEWVTIENPDPSDATTNPHKVYQEGQSNGAMTFGRLEGIWYGHGNMYLNSTDGGDKELGQIWKYTPAGSTGVLTLIFESKDPKVLQSPDNLCVSPRGGLVLCEDGDGPNFVRGLTTEGLIFDLVKNEFENGKSEFAGACFSPDGNTLFVNMQYPGRTFAIWGPWERGVL